MYCKKEQPEMMLTQIYQAPKVGEYEHNPAFLWLLPFE